MTCQFEPMVRADDRLGMSRMLKKLLNVSQKDTQSFDWIVTLKRGGCVGLLAKRSGFQTYLVDKCSQTLR